VNVKDVVRWLLRVRSSEAMTLLHNALAGGLTGFVSTLASCPIELVKCRTQGMLELVSKPNSGSSAAVATNAALRFYYLVIMPLPGPTSIGGGIFSTCLFDVHLFPIL